MEKDNLKKKPSVGIAIMPENDFLKACLPLFQEEQIDAIEWSFDTIVKENSEPEWLTGLLDDFSFENKLLGHGVYYSLFDANWTKRQDSWLEKLKRETKKRKYNHISEHFGFMSSSDYHSGFPLPVSLNQTTLRIGIDRVKRLQDSVQLPVGVENLAFSFSKNDVEEQGKFIEKIIESVGGFVILDLHNIYCQSHNFEIDILDLVDLYPLTEVKEIHVSGGSWQNSLYQKDKKIRRDTHDDCIPREIFDVLPKVLSRCQNVEFVIFERLGNSFKIDSDYLDYLNDFKRLKSIVENQSYTENNKIWTRIFELEKIPFTDLELQLEQKILADALSKIEDCSEIKKMIFKNWDLSSWDLEMIHTATQISKKWRLESH